MGFREGKTSDEDETSERKKKNQDKGSQKFYVWETKYRAKISDREQLLEIATEIHRKCQQHIKINTEMNIRLETGASSLDDTVYLSNSAMCFDLN